MEIWIPSPKTSFQDRKVGSHCPLQSLNLYNWQQSTLSLKHCSREANTWMDSLSSQVFPKSGRSRKEQMGMALSREEGSFWQGSYNRMVLSVRIELGKGSCEGRAAGHAASLPWKQPNCWLGRFRNASCLGLLSVDVIYLCRV